MFVSVAMFQQTTTQKHSSFNKHSGRTNKTRTTPTTAAAATIQSQTLNWAFSSFTDWLVNASLASCLFSRAFFPGFFYLKKAFKQQHCRKTNGIKTVVTK